LTQIAVLGARGMLGSDLVEDFASRGVAVAPLDLDDLDITDPDACMRAIGAQKPSCVINCAAYTDVNRAEAEPDLAMAVNGAGAGNVARACGAAGARCVLVSTDYVFDGTKAGPYTENDAPNPTGAYGRSKLEGERQTASALDDHLIVRTSWLFGARGRNFVTAVLAMAGAGKPLRIVSDQVGAPTYTRDLARALADAALGNACGILHVTNSGECSWHGFARRVFELTAIAPPSLTAITAGEYPSPVRRPANSRLDCSAAARAGIARRHRGTMHCGGTCSR
jgi:dTDP-4-dehydrorhamnose reductase